VCLPHYVDIGAFTAGIVTLGFIFGAYAGQVFRGAFQMIPIGQREAAHAVGMSSFAIAWRIILPQTWCYALPGLGNLWLVLLKDSALVSLIGLMDLMGQAHLSASNTHLYFNFYLFAAGMYLLLTFFSELMIRQLTRWANKWRV